jgi:hypothetical protein
MTLRWIFVFFLALTICRWGRTAQPESDIIVTATLESSGVFSVVLPPLSCRSSHVVKIRLATDKKDYERYDRLKSDCGCIRILSDEFDAEEAANAPLRFQVEMPKTEEVQTRYLKLSNSENGESIRVAVRYTAVNSVQPKSKWLLFEPKEDKDVSVELSFPFGEVDLSEAKCEIMNPIIASAIVSQDGDTAPKLKLILKEEASKFSELSTPVRVLMYLDKTAAITMDLLLCNASKTLVNPRPIELVEVDSGFKGEVTFKSYKLQDALDNDDIRGESVQISLVDMKSNSVADDLTVTSSFKEISTGEFRVKFTLSNVSEASLKKARLLMFTYGSWKKYVPFR